MAPNQFPSLNVTSLVFYGGEETLCDLEECPLNLFPCELPLRLVLGGSLASKALSTSRPRSSWKICFT